ncbi:MAG: hypothetical protein AAF610_06325 [Pseudomonadota bacterium]
MSDLSDRELQMFLDNRGDLAEQLSANLSDAPQPSAALDRAILADARAEADRPARPRWWLPASVAATVVLAVGISHQVQRAGTSAVQSVAETDIVPDTTRLETAAPNTVSTVTSDRAAPPAPPVPRPSMADIPKIEVDTERRPERALGAKNEVQALARQVTEERERIAPSLPKLQAPETPPQEDSQSMETITVTGSRLAEHNTGLVFYDENTAADSARVPVEPVPGLASSMFPKASEPPFPDTESALTRIRFLIAQGRDEDARTLLRELFAHDGDLELPEDFPLSLSDLETAEAPEREPGTP